MAAISMTMPIFPLYVEDLCGAGTDPKVVTGIEFAVVTAVALALHPLARASLEGAHFHAVLVHLTLDRLRAHHGARCETHSELPCGILPGFRNPAVIPLDRLDDQRHDARNDGHDEEEFHLSILPRYCSTPPEFAARTW